MHVREKWKHVVLGFRRIEINFLAILIRVQNVARKAIAALDNGEYGICEDCEEPIAARRLDVMPWASVCVKCQEARDRQRGDADDIFSMAA